MKNKLKKYKPFDSRQFEEQAAWLAAMAREGWHYKGQDFIGFQHFEAGAPAELEYCWDKAPRGNGNAMRYRQQCRENGWELAGNSGNWFCWTRVAAAGETRPAPRDRQRTRALCRKNGKHHWTMAALALLVFCLLLAAALAKAPGMLRWTDLPIVVFLLSAAGSARNALRAQSRVRALT